MHFSAIDAGRWQALRLFPTTTCALAFKIGKTAAVRVRVPGDDGARRWQYTKQQRILRLMRKFHG